MYTQTIGKRGEECVAQYLARNGFTIAARNVHTRWGEIDILAFRNSTLHVIEVKTRQSTTYGTPEEAMTREKFGKLKKSVLEFTQRSFGFPTRWQIDFVAVELHGVEAEKAQLRFYWNIGLDDIDRYA